MEAFFSILHRAKEGGFISSFSISRRGVGQEVSHLLFVDDTLILYDVSKENIKYLSWTFMWFEAI